jgi:hypothetical protein
LCGCFLWAVFLEITEVAKILDNFLHSKNYVLILTENGLGYILGEFFFKNSFGHPANSTYTVSLFLFAAIDDFEH